MRFPYPTCFIALIASMGVAVFTLTAQAETPAERELQQLHEQRERDLAATAQRIDRLYRAALEKLLLRAVQNRDYEASARINETLLKVPDPAAAPAR